MTVQRMTKFGAFALKISIAILFMASTVAEASVRVRRKGVQKLNPDEPCQLLLLTPEMDPDFPFHETAEQEETRKLSDLTLMQGSMFDALINQNFDLAKSLRTRIENQLYTLRLPKTPSAYANNHELYDISVNRDSNPGTRGKGLSYVLLREEPDGRHEIAAYEVVQALGNPIQMPVTIPYRQGSLQVFHGYPDVPAKKIDPATGKEIIPHLKIEALNTEKKREIQHNIALDSDLFLVDFLTLNKGRYAENVVYDVTRKNPLIAYDWDAAFMAGRLANFEFFDLASSWYGTPALSPDLRDKNEFYDGAKAILRQHLANSLFDWKKALNNLTPEKEERLINALKLRLQDYQAALQLRGQICALRAALFDGDLRACQKLGFNLSRNHQMNGPDYRQHSRD